ncbi:MAG TPA: heparan-alpha-glucosaminide N-acetyltransferase domain-containing protein, partial [Vicinamibacteria bacterium]|nr:heparan-alpha-glucosaminide N-acetyltransferase domain-containing protein [Vicinamibacteria bacterium]
SLDVFRGATIAAMILVNNPGDWGHVYWPLLHVPWHGWTPTDLIFPFFLFIVGMSLTFSRRLGARPAFARALKLIGLGLLMALYPYFPVLTVRWPGVLQRIGVCYLAAWAAKRWLRPRGQAVLAACLLVGYWALMTKATGPEGHPPNLEPQTNLSAQVDRIVLVPHVWSVTKTWDPEGVLSTLPAIATTLLGLLFGEWVRSGRQPFPTTLGLLLGGLALTTLGILWGEAAAPWLVFPINKSIWTSSFVLLTGGLAAALFGLTYWVVDVVGWKRWATPFVTYGKNAIAVFVGSGLLAKTLLSIKWPDGSGVAVSLWRRLYEALYASWLPPYGASLAWAVSMVVLFYLVALWMDRRGLYLKV